MQKNENFDICILWKIQKMPFSNMNISHNLVWQYFAGRHKKRQNYQILTEFSNITARSLRASSSPLNSWFRVKWPHKEWLSNTRSSKDALSSLHSTSLMSCDAGLSQPSFVSAARTKTRREKLTIGGQGKCLTETSIWKKTKNWAKFLWKMLPIFGGLSMEVWGPSQLQTD